MAFRRKRMWCRGIVEMSRPSISMRPEEMGRRRKRVDRSVDFPEPVRPTMASFWPGAMETEILSKALREFSSVLQIHVSSEYGSMI